MWPSEVCMVTRRMIRHVEWRAQQAIASVGRPSHQEAFARIRSLFFQERLKFDARGHEMTGFLEELNASSDQDPVAPPHVDWQAWLDAIQSRKRSLLEGEASCSLCGVTHKLHFDGVDTLYLGTKRCHAVKRPSAEPSAT